MAVLSLESRRRVPHGRSAAGSDLVHGLPLAHRRVNSRHVAGAHEIGRGYEAHLHVHKVSGHPAAHAREEAGAARSRAWQPSAYTCRRSPCAGCFHAADVRTDGSNDLKPVRRGGPGGRVRDGGLGVWGVPGAGADGSGRSVTGHGVSMQQARGLWMPVGPDGLAFFYSDRAVHERAPARPAAGALAIQRVRRPRRRLVIRQAWLLA